MALYTPKYQPNGNEVAVIKTSKGDIRVELAGDDAPIHVGNFVELAQKGFYDDLKFHRYVPGFVIQGGCPNTRDLDSEQVKAAEGNPFARLGTGGPGYTIHEEYTTNPNNKHLAGHGPFPGSELCGFSVLSVPRRSAFLGLWLHRIRPDGRRP